MTLDSPIPGLLLAGTDTAVGKTTLASALLRAASSSGRRLVPFKPFETGCVAGHPADAAALLAAAQLPGLALSQVCLHAFEPPIAPSIAIRLQGRPVAFAAVLAHARSLVLHGDGLLVEGAGGLLTPLAPKRTAADLAQNLGLPVLLVAANRLGAINHTALAADALRNRRLPCIGFVLVDTSPIRTPDHAWNATEIESEAGLPHLGTLRHIPDPQPDLLASAARADLALEPILLAATIRQRV